MAEFWTTTPRLFALRVEAKRRVFEREHNGRAWLAFHIAYLPLQKRAVPLADLMISAKAGSQPKGWQSTAEIETTMRRWRFAMTAPRPNLTRRTPPRGAPS